MKQVVKGGIDIHDIRDGLSVRPNLMRKADYITYTWKQDNDNTVYNVLSSTSGVNKTMYRINIKPDNPEPSPYLLVYAYDWANAKPGLTQNSKFPTVYKPNADYIQQCRVTCEVGVLTVIGFGNSGDVPDPNFNPPTYPITLNVGQSVELWCPNTRKVPQRYRGVKVYGTDATEFSIEWLKIEEVQDGEEPRPTAIILHEDDQKGLTVRPNLLKNAMFYDVGNTTAYGNAKAGTVKGGSDLGQEYPAGTEFVFSCETILHEDDTCVNPRVSLYESNPAGANVRVFFADNSTPKDVSWCTVERAFKLTNPLRYISGWLLDYSSAGSNFHREYRNAKLEVVLPGEVARKTAYIPHIDDLKGQDGKPGIQGRMPRPRGVFDPSKMYQLNKDFADVVATKDGEVIKYWMRTGTEPETNTAPPNTTVWAEVGALSPFIAASGIIGKLSAGQIDVDSLIVGSIRPKSFRVNYAMFGAPGSPSVNSIDGARTLGILNKDLISGRVSNISFALNAASRDMYLPDSRMCAHGTTITYDIDLENCVVNGAIRVYVNGARDIPKQLQGVDGQMYDSSRVNIRYFPYSDEDTYPTVPIDAGADCFTITKPIGEPSTRLGCHAILIFRCTEIYFGNISYRYWTWVNSEDFLDRGYQTQPDVSAQIGRQVLQGRMPAKFDTLGVYGLSSLAGLSVKVNTPAEVGRANEVSISAKEFGYIDFWGGNQPGTLRITDLEVGGLLLLHLSERSIGYWWNGPSNINGGTGLRVDVNNGAWQYIKKPGLYLIHRFATASGKIEIHRIANYDSQEGSSYVYY